MSDPRYQPPSPSPFLEPRSYSEAPPTYQPSVPYRKQPQRQRQREESPNETLKGGEGAGVAVGSGS